MITIIAPASSCKDANQKLQQAIELLQAKGLEVVVKEDILTENELPFFAAPRAIRLQGLREALLNPEVKIILTFRGGYGCTEIVFDCMNIKPVGQKILIGFSDITALHLLFNQHYNIASIHGAVLTSLFTEQVVDQIIANLNGKETKLALKPINAKTDKIKGKITGGNLTVFCNMLGTKLHPDTNGKILILEDVNEKSYQVHRHLVHLKNAGIFADVKAVIFGDFIKSNETLESAIDHFCFNHIEHIPTYRVTGIGHGEVNYPIVFGVDAIIESKQLTVSGLICGLE